MYNRVSLSVNSIRAEMLSPEGHVMTLLDFYNEIFLAETQDLVSNDNTLLNVLSTPMRSHLLDTSISGQISIKTPLPTRMKDLSSNRSFEGIKMIKTENDNYKKL